MKNSLQIALQIHPKVPPFSTVGQVSRNTFSIGARTESRGAARGPLRSAGARRTTAAPADKGRPAPRWSPLPAVVSKLVAGAASGAGSSIGWGVLTKHVAVLTSCGVFRTLDVAVFEDRWGEPMDFGRIGDFLERKQINKGTTLFLWVDFSLRPPGFVV